MDDELIRVVFGIIANVISICLFASAVPTFYRAVKKNDSLNDINPYYYIAMTIGCLLWVFYGLPFINPGNVLLLTAYGTGVAINIAYLAIFLLYANRQRMYVASVLLTGLLVLGLVFGLVIGLGHTFHTRTYSLGPVCFFFSSVMLVPRGSLASQVMFKKSVECMPFLTVLSDTLNGLCWFIYAILGSDTFFLSTNGLGVVMGLYQLIVYCVYRSAGTPKSCDDQELAETSDKELAETADKELSQAEHDRKLSRAEHDKKLALQLEHDKIKQALARVELELAKFGPVDEFDMV